MSNEQKMASETQDVQIPVLQQPVTSTEVVEAPAAETRIIEAPVEIVPGTPLSAQIEKGGQTEKKARNKSYVMDLRIHSPSSLGYLAIEGIDTAPALVRLARVKGLDMIAVTDFHSGQFIDRVKHAASESNLTVIPGAVVRCQLGACDDVTLTCLFPEHFTTSGIEDVLSALRVPLASRGDRRYKLQLPFGQVISTIESFGGVAMPSRMDKTPHRQAVLPALVDEFGFRAFDLAYPDSVAFFKGRWPRTKFQLFSFSNANALAQVGSRIARVKMLEGGFNGVKQLLVRQSGSPVNA